MPPVMQIRGTVTTCVSVPVAASVKVGGVVNVQLPDDRTLIPSLGETGTIVRERVRPDIGIMFELVTATGTCMRVPGSHSFSPLVVI